MLVCGAAGILTSSINSSEAKSSTILEVGNNFNSFLQRTKSHSQQREVSSVYRKGLVNYLIVSAPDTELDESLKISLGSLCWYISINTVSFRRNWKRSFK